MGSFMAIQRMWAIWIDRFFYGVIHVASLKSLVLAVVMVPRFGILRMPWAEIFENWVMGSILGLPWRSSSLPSMVYAG
jgi:hypothetical protein